MPSSPPALQVAFLAAPQTLANVHGDFAAWHAGRPWFWLWTIDVDTAAVAARMQAASRYLATRLLPGYQRQAHITLSLCGFPVTEEMPADGYTPVHLQTQLRALRKLAQAPFNVQVGGLDSFQSAPFLQVPDTARHVAGLQRALAQHPLDHAPTDYVPHVTVGLYAGCWPTAALAAQIAVFPLQAALTLPVQSLSLMRYASRQVGGPLQTLAHYDLASAALHWHPAASDSLDARWLVCGQASD